MRDTHTTREDHDGAVGVKGFEAAVRAFDESVEDEATLGILSLFVESVCEAVAAADDGGHGGLWVGEEILPIHNEAFFGVEIFLG